MRPPAFIVLPRTPERPKPLLIGPFPSKNKAKKVRYARQLQTKAVCRRIYEIEATDLQRGD